MRILYLCPMVPYPTTDGGRQRLHHLLAGIAAEHAVFFGAVSEGDESTEAWPMARRLAAPPLVVRTDTRSKGPQPAVLASGALTPATVRRMHATAFWDRLCELPLASFDAVQVEGAALAGYGLAIKEQYPRIRLVFDAHNLEWHLRMRSATATPHWWRKRAQLSRALEALRWYWFEKTMLRQYDSVLACSEQDKKRLSKWVDPGRIAVVPNGTDVTAGALPPPPVGSKDLVFVGMMSYRPNVEGVDFFCRSVWPMVRAKEPHAQFWVVGKGVSEDTRALAVEGSGIHVTGMVPDVRPYLERAVATVIPLLSGGGTRLKILEAMASRRAVLSTSVGAEGIEATGDREIVYADTAEALADGCVTLLREADFRDLIADGGLNLALRKYDWRLAQKALLERYATLDSGAGARL